MFDLICKIIIEEKLKMNIDEYISKMYRDGFNGITTPNGVNHTGYCPFCGGTQWDLDDNKHTGKNDILTNSCDDCGAKWIEEWELKKVVKIQ